MFGISSFLKPSVHISGLYQRQVYITNVLSIIFCWVALGIVAIYYFFFGWLAALPYLFLVALSFLAVPFINRFNHSIGRMIFCLIPIWLTMLVTIYFKLNETRLSYIVYFDSRFILMATPILPGIIFRLQERKQLFVCMGSATIALIFYDLIHQLFGADYYQQGFTDPSYYYINYIVTVTFLVLIFGILLLRSIMEKSEAELEQQNRELHQKQNEIEAQHEELLQQQEEVLSSSEKLETANALIMKQQTALEKYNASLEALVNEKSHELVNTNEELIRHNNELLQFSYTVSHNLRGPVARLLGLTRLFKVTKKLEEKTHLENLVLQSSEELDEILRDLSLIIDIRNDIYSVREKVFLEDEFKKALSLLGDNVKPEYQFDVNFSLGAYIFGVRPMIQSILYNLLSNAIKYRNPEKLLHVTVSSRAVSAEQTVLEIRDNGLGIDLLKQGKDIFKLYKRFHSHVGGRGLGLYLVKTQVEALGGKISVESEPNKGTVFQITFTQPEEVHRQIFHDSEAVQLYYDGNLKICVIRWKKQASSKVYRETFSVALNALKVYKTHGWISDVSQQGTVAEEDQLWLFNTLAPEAIDNGLRQIAIVGADETSRYFKRFRKTSDANQVGLRFFSSMDEALLWMGKS